MSTPPGGGGRDDAGPPRGAGPPSWDAPPPSWSAGEQTRIGTPGAWSPPPAGMPPPGWPPQQGPPQQGPPYPGPPQQGPPYPGPSFQGPPFQGPQQQGPPPGWGQPGPPGWGQPPGPWGAAGSWGAPARSAPPPRGGRALALVLVGALVLAGLGVGAFLLVRATIAGGDAVPADFRRTTAAGLTFSVPPEWTPSPGSGLTVAGAAVQGVQNGDPYACGGAEYVRVFSGVALLAAGVPPAAAAEQVAREAGAVLYRTGAGELAQVSTGAPRAVDAGGAPAQLVEARVRASPDPCLASEGLLLVLAVPVAEGTAVLVVSADSAGGPAGAPAVPGRAELDAVIASARPGGGI